MDDKKKKAKELLSTFVNQLTPEIRTPIAAMQPQEVNPYARIGPVPATEYSFANRISGFAGSEPMVNPEA